MCQSRLFYKLVQSLSPTKVARSARFLLKLTRGENLEQIFFWLIQCSFDANFLLSFSLPANLIIIKQIFPKFNCFYKKQNQLTRKKSKSSKKLSSSEHSMSNKKGKPVQGLHLRLLLKVTWLLFNVLYIMPSSYYSHLKK